MEAKRVRIAWRNGALFALLGATPTSAALPIESAANTWGEEVYFSVPVNVKLDPDAR